MYTNKIRCFSFLSNIWLASTCKVNVRFKQNVVIQNLSDCFTDDVINTKLKKLKQQ